MRTRLPWIVVLALAAGGMVWGSQGRAADEAAIRRHIESIFDAFIEKDRDKLAATHGRDWRGYLTGSRTVIKGRDGYMRAAVGDGPMGPRGQGMVGYKILEYDTVWYDNVAGGGKLVRLEFPRTEIQAYGATAIIYTSYVLEVAEGGKTRTERGKATEVFVRRGGRWLNTGWQLAPETGH